MKILTLVLALLLITAPSFSANLEIFDETDLGAKIDAPNLIVKKGNHALGVEVSINDITRDWKDGSQAYIKYTWSGSIFDLDK